VVIAETNEMVSLVTLDLSLDGRDELIIIIAALD
jgi:hypothetical protein